MSLASCSNADAPKRVAGYVESDIVYLSSEEAGAIAQIFVTEGEAVAQGAPVFRLDTDKMTLAAHEAEWRAAAAKKRASPDGALSKAVAEADAGARVAGKALSRTAALRKDGYAPAARLDEATANAAAADARLARARAELRAAEDDSAAAEAAAALMRKRLSDMAVAAPAGGVVERIYRRVGEVVAPGAPVVSIRPSSAVKLRFFAPEPVLAKLSVGGTVGYSCDGCAAGLVATVTFIAADPQFTPPVIYSRTERQKLVYLVEARPAAGGAALAEGQPVEVALP